MTLHIVNPMWDIAGSEWRALSLYRLLRDRAPTLLWTENRPDPRMAGLAPIRRIRAFRFPRGGTFVFVGAYFRVGWWWRWARPGRTILVYNTHTPGVFRKRLHQLSLGGRRPVETVFASRWLGRTVGQEGPVQVSPIDVARFAPREGDAATFVVGRLSRDVPEKHAETDPALYRRLAAAGIPVRVMGGTCLGRELGGVGGVELLPAGAVDAADFLRGIDCLLYRTSSATSEAFGRVVLEAMACGLPVVCDARGGPTEFVEHGRTGFLVVDANEAFEAVSRLRADRDLRAAMGRAGREAAERLSSPEACEKIAAFYLGWCRGQDSNLHEV